jgi:hypothetical protein
MFANFGKHPHYPTDAELPVGAQGKLGALLNHPHHVDSGTHGGTPGQGLQREREAIDTSRGHDGASPAQLSDTPASSSVPSGPVTGALDLPQQANENIASSGSRASSSTFAAPHGMPSTRNRRSTRAGKGARPRSRPVRRSDTHKPVQSTEGFPWFRDEMDNKVVGVLYKSDPHYHVMKHGPREWIAEPMVRCTDGQVRRFPPSGDRSSNYASQVRLGLIYDIPADRVIHRIGGIEISPDHSEVAFLSGGNPVRPIKVGQFDAYQLPGGRFMIPQPTFRDCTYACELMMALDQGSVSIDTARGYPMPRQPGATLGTRSTRWGLAFSASAGTS